MNVEQNDNESFRSLAATLWQSVADDHSSWSTNRNDQRWRLDKCQESYFHRFYFFCKVCSPLTLWSSDIDIANARNLQYNFHAHRANKSFKYSNFSKALQLRYSACHPETGDIIPRPFRRAAFTAFNTPLYFLMLVTPNTHAWNLCWQLVNQSYNCFLNYFNRSDSSTASENSSTLLKNFAFTSGVASIAAISAKIGLNKFSKQLKLNPLYFRFAVPLAATQCSGLLNLYLTRKDEIINGIAVRRGPDGDSEILGYSQNAAWESMRANLASRAILPIIPLVIPGIMTTRLASVRPMLKYPLLLGTVFMSQLFALPFSLAFWPLFMDMDVDDLEPELRQKIQFLSRESGERVEKVYFNKGM